MVSDTVSIYIKCVFLVVRPFFVPNVVFQGQGQISMSHKKNGLSGSIRVSQTHLVLSITDTMTNR